MDVPVEPWPADGLESVPVCPLCGSADREILHKGMTDRVFYCAPGEWSLFRCLGCSSGYLDPWPTPETLGMAYASYYTHTTQTPPADGLMGRVRQRAANGYRNYRFGTQDQPASAVLGRLVPVVLPQQSETIDAESRHLPPAKPGDRLLDVGCGNGQFLDFARRAGWAVTGVDLDEKAVEAARSRGLDVRHGGIEVLEGVEQFDGITMGHVIEHVYDPRGLLAKVFALLKPGGWVWIDTPNLDSLGHERYGADWRDLDPPRHLILFTLDSLRGCLRDAGFEGEEMFHYALVATSSFPASEAIARREPSSAAANYVEATREAAAEAVRRQEREPAVREYLTMRVWKPASGAA